MLIHPNAHRQMALNRANYQPAVQTALIKLFQVKFSAGCNILYYAIVVYINITCNIIPIVSLHFNFFQLSVIKQSNWASGINNCRFWIWEQPAKSKEEPNLFARMHLRNHNRAQDLMMGEEWVTENGSCLGQWLALTWHCDDWKNTWVMDSENNY